MVYLIVSLAKTLSVLQREPHILKAIGAAERKGSGLNCETKVVSVWVFPNAHSTYYFQDRLLYKHR